MVSRQDQTLYSRKRDLTIYGEEFHNSFKKTKQEDKSHAKLHSNLFNERPNSENMRSISFDFELHLHTHAKGQPITFQDHRTYPNDQVIVGRPKMSLDLELNLSPSYSPSRTTTTTTTTTTKIDESSSNHNETMSSSKGKNLKSITGTGINRSLSWLAFQGGDDGDDHKEQEMVTKVCMKCHMLVMLCTSTPVCPNCKFMHPHDHSSTKMFKPSNLLRLLC